MSLRNSPDRQPRTGASSGAAGPTLPVVIQAAERGTQILVIDASFVKLASGVGRLDVSLSPGLYKARFKAGDRIRDELFEVSKERVNIQGRALEFSSPIPLEKGTSNGHEYQAGPAQHLARSAPNVTLGDGGGELILFVRDSAQKYGAPLSAFKPWEGLRLRKSDHSVLFDLETNRNVDVLAGYGGAKIALSPGVYFVSQPEGPYSNGADRMLELPITVCKGWCTHVYVDSDDSCPIGPGAALIETKGGARRADLAGAAMAMVRVQPGGGAVLDPEIAMLSELARQGLMSGQQAISEDDLNSLVAGKFQYPMFGLYAMHLLLDRPPVNWSHIAEIAGNIDRLLEAGHADVRVLVDICMSKGLTVNKAQAAPPTRLWPPVLAATWDLAEFAAAGFQGTWPSGRTKSFHDGLRGRLGAPAGASTRKRYRVPARVDDERLRQFRVSGSIWSCLLVPEATLSAWSRRIARKAPGLADDLGNTYVVNASNVIGSVLQEQHESPIAEDRLTARRRPKIVADVSPSLDEWKDIAAGLRRPNPNHTPFQQALRRRVLDLVPRGSTTSVDQDPEQYFDFDELAVQFHLTRSKALKAYLALRREAQTAVMNPK